MVDKTIDRLQGHVSLKNTLRILSHVYELQRRYPDQPEYARAFTAQALKVSLDVAQQGGSWDLAWPLLGLVDPEGADQHALSPSERVALAALAKEKKVINEIASAARAKRTAPSGKKSEEG